MNHCFYETGQSLWCSRAHHEAGVSVARSDGKENLFLILLWVRNGVLGRVCCSGVCPARSCLGPVAGSGSFQTNLSEIIPYSSSAAWFFFLNFIFSCFTCLIPWDPGSLYACSCHRLIISTWLWEIRVKHWFFKITIFRYSLGLHFRPESNIVSARSDKNKYEAAVKAKMRVLRWLKWSFFWLVLT